jgi:hypothetical protein
VEGQLGGPCLHDHVLLAFPCNHEEATRPGGSLARCSLQAVSALRLSSSGTPAQRWAFRRSTVSTDGSHRQRRKTN